MINTNSSGLERFMKALANRRRMAIVKHLYKSGESTVGDIAAHIKLSFKATSKHLGILAANDIVGREQSGLSMHYALNKPIHPIADLLIVHI